MKDTAFSGNNELNQKEALYLKLQNCSIPSFPLSQPFRLSSLFGPEAAPVQGSLRPFIYP